MSRTRDLPPLAAILAVLLALAPPPAIAAGPADYVVHISVDGLRADLLQNLIATDPANHPNFKRFIDQGATTFNARTDYSHTITLPNHACMITGRPVLQPSGQPNTVHHGYTSNSDPSPTQTLHNSGNLNIPYKASTFDVVHDHGWSTAHYASKTKFVLYDRSYDAAHGAPDATGENNGTDKVDAYVSMSIGSPETAANMNAAFVTALGANHYRYSFVHYVDPDAAGHSLGWGSSGWNTAVRNVDAYLGALFDVIENDATLHGHTAVILSTDHGGTGTGHSTASDLLNHRIPFMVWGAGVAPGADLYALNPATRLDPGTGQPEYGAAIPPIRNGDGGNLALALLGLPAIPGSTVNASQDLNVAAIPTSVPLPAPRGVVASPNPFTRATALTFVLPATQDVEVAVYDVAGRLVRHLRSGRLPAGEHRVAWDGRDDDGRIRAGALSFIRVKAGGADLATKVIHMR